jgi:hypothetical protein
MRHVGEIRSGKNTKQVVNRALQFAKSEPMGALFSLLRSSLDVRELIRVPRICAGPVYVWGQREATEEHIDPANVPKVRSDVWSPVELAPLNKSCAPRILRHAIPIIVRSPCSATPPQPSPASATPF